MLLICKVFTYDGSICCLAFNSFSYAKSNYFIKFIVNGKLIKKKKGFDTLWEFEADNVFNHHENNGVMQKGFLFFRKSIIQYLLYFSFDFGL